MKVKPELISFNICPFVQRSVITLLKKNIDFDVKYIDLSEPPQWFLDISPMGKVPTLKVGDSVLFESAVINEYLDEVTPPSMHPSDPLEKAKNKAWIEFASDMIGNQYYLTIEKDEQLFVELLQKIENQFVLLEGHLSGVPFFNGENFSLIDAAFAPLFMRYEILQRIFDVDVLSKHPKISQWSSNLLAMDAVKKSVVSDFESLYIKYMKDNDSCLLCRST